jgi:small multidrug resistance pump
MSVGFLLALAIGIEVVGTCAVRQSDGFTRPGWVTLMLVCYGISFFLLSRIVKEMPLGLAYAIWAGCGTALIAVVAVFLFDEGLTLVSAAGIALVIGGIVLINVAGATH